jgi:hypothetical protein
VDGDSTISPPMFFSATISAIIPHAKHMNAVTGTHDKPHVAFDQQHTALKFVLEIARKIRTMN